MPDKSNLRSLVAFMAITWVVIATTRYVMTVLKSLQHPYNSGDEAIFVIVWLSAAVIILVSLGLHQRIATTLSLLLISAASLTMIVRSGNSVAALIALWVVVVAVLLGFRILSFLQIGLSDSAAGLSVAFPLGLAILALFTYILAVVGELRSSSVWILLALVTGFELTHALAAKREILRERLLRSKLTLDLESRVVLLLMAAGFAVNLIWTVAPEVRFDALNYHLAVPRLYIEANGLVDLPYFFHSYFAHLAEMLFAFGMALHGEMVVKIMNALVGVMVTVAVYSLGNTVFTPRVALWAAAFFYSTPLICSLTGTAGTDLLLVLFVTAACIAFLGWWRNRQSKWLALTGFLIGNAVAVKLNALYVAVGLSSALLVALVTTKSLLRNKVRIVAMLVLPAALIAIPWYLPSYVHTGNPVFPLLNGIFKSPKAELTNSMLGDSPFGIGTSLAALVRIPFRLSFDTARFGEDVPAGMLGPLLLLFVPFGLVVIFKKVETRVLGLIAFVYFILWAETLQYARFYLLILPITVVLAVAGVDFAFPDRLARRIAWMSLLILLIFQMVVLPVHYWSIPDRFPLAFALGLESRDSLLARALDGYDSVQVINRSIAPGAKVLGIDAENLRFYLKPPLETLAESLLDSPIRPIAATPPGPELARQLSRLNISYLLTSRIALKNPPSYYPYATQEFLRNYGKLVQADEFIVAYRLRSPEE
jgi:hypothetical protein